MAFSESIARRDPGTFDDIIWREAGSDASLFALIKGLIARESAWNVGAYRYEPAMGEGSVGLMQVLPSTASGVLRRPVTTSDLFIPEINIAAGGGYLRDQLRRYGDARRAVSAYNCGSECLTRPTSFWPSGNWPYADDVITYQTWYLNHLPAQGSVIEPPETWATDEEPMPDDTGAWSPEATSALAAGAGLLVIGAAVLYMRRR